jgi:hypothetical protein
VLTSGGDNSLKEWSFNLEWLLKKVLNIIIKWILN